MRALAPALVALALFVAPAAAADCMPDVLERFGAEAMVADHDLRHDAVAALDACAAMARDQLRNTGEIEDRLMDQIATLAGRTALASYAADEIPVPPAALVDLLAGSFRQLYPRLRNLPEEQSAAAMRALVFHLMDRTGPATTGSIR
jgi:hypothetical protein